MPELNKLAIFHSQSVFYYYIKTSVSSYQCYKITPNKLR